MSVTVSLAITTYKSASYLLRTLSSTLNQIVPFDEILVIDDCSNDNSKQIVDSFNNTFNQKILFHTLPSNFGGPARSRNTALSLSSCQIITYLDADDVLLPSRCLNVKTLYLSQPFDACICRGCFFKIDPSTDSLIRRRAFPPQRVSPYLTLPDLLNLSLLTPGSSLSFRTSTLKSYKFSEDSNIIAGEDREVLIRLAIDSRPIIYTNHIDFLYNSGFINSSFLLDDQHITSPQRSLQIISFLRMNYSFLLPNKYYASFDLSELIALFRLGRYYDFFAYLLTLSPLSILNLARVCLSRIFDRFSS